MADTAAKNNTVAHAIIGGLVLWTAYDIYSTYENEGPEAALQELAVQGAIQVVSVGVGKVAYKVGGKVYPHAKLAWEAVVAENPVLYKAAEACANVAHKLKDRIASAPAVEFLEKLKGKTVWDKGPVVRGEIIEKKSAVKAKVNPDTIAWVDEKAVMGSKARTYNDSAIGARSNAISKNPQAPSLEYTAQDGVKKLIRFDGVDGAILVDRKIAIVTTEKVKNQALRQSTALHQNGLTGRWEVPDKTQADRALKLLESLKVKNIEVKIVKTTNIK